MNITAWTLSGLLAAVFIAAGSMKLLSSQEKLVSSGQLWAADFPARLIKLIGAAEVLGAAGLILPGLLDVATWLVPLAAVGLASTMLGAVGVHAKRGEVVNIVINLVLLAAALFVAFVRLGPANL